MCTNKEKLSLKSQFDKYLLLHVYETNNGLKFAASVYTWQDLIAHKVVDREEAKNQ